MSTLPTIPRHVRSYLYGVCLAVAPAAVLYGWLSTEEVAVWTGVILTVLGLGTARVYTPSVDEEAARIAAREHAAPAVVINEADPRRWSSATEVDGYDDRYGD